jgi:SEC-C motif domain protein
MRSRFTAFALNNPQYLLDTWHRSTRPRTLTLDAEIDWYRLDVLATTAGGPLDRDGTVEFEAHFRHDGKRGSQHELSQFRREDGRWYYVGELV